MNDGTKRLNILLADDDTDDRYLFDKALKELEVPVNYATVKNGEELMHFLAENSGQLPDILFLDLNMPLKTGFECLCEISENEKLKDLAVVVLTTSFPQDKNYEMGIISSLFNLGVRVFIRKPNDFEELKQVIAHSITMATENSRLKYNLNS